MRLHRALNGEPDVTPPYEWVISRICDEFQCLPSQAVRELEDGDRALVFDVLECRTYARAKEALDTAQRKDDVKVTPSVHRVMQIEAELMQIDGMTG